MDVITIIHALVLYEEYYTKQIVARMGRAGVVGERSLGYPDAGACALGVIFTEVVNQLEFKL